MASTFMNRYYRRWHNLYYNVSQDMLASSKGSGDYANRKDTYRKVNVISQEQFHSQRRETERDGERHDVLEDDLQFNLDDGGEESKQTKPPPGPQTNPETDTSSSGSTRQHLPWLEKRARFYPAPILPDKSDSKV